MSPPVFDDSDAPAFLGPGRYLAEITACEEKQSRKGDPMFVIDMIVADGEGAGSNLARDWILLAGKGAGMGKAKLKGFGIEINKGDSIEADDLVGRRAFAHVDNEEFEGNTNLRVQADQGRYCGYSEAPQDANSIPF